MLNKLKEELISKFGDEKLIENLFYSFQKISEEYVAQKPVDLLQNVGLFVESTLRVSEHIIFGSHTPLSDKFNVDNTITRLEGASGTEGIRIHVARLSRAIYDFRTRKKSVHLKSIDPQLIDAELIFNIANWIMIEILKESSISNPEKIILLFYSRKIPVVQEIDGIFRTTNPILSGPQRILLLLYSAPSGLNEDELFEGTKIKIQDMHHLKINLKNLYKKDLIHCRKDKSWILFGKGFVESEDIIKKICL